MNKLYKKVIKIITLLNKNNFLNYMKQSLLEKTAFFLLKKGFTIKSLTRTCFDILARKDSLILLLKILEDANAISKECSDEMKKVSSYINASPIIIAEKAAFKLENNVVYSRFGIYTLNIETFKNSVENKFPFISRSKAGLIAYIKGDKLRKKREELGLSLNSLSNKLGVSSRMVSRYESGIQEITLKKAFKLYDIFGGEVFNKINLFDPQFTAETNIKTPITKKYSDLGFEASEVKKAPFNIIAKKEKEIILTDVGDKTSPNLQSLSKLIDAHDLVIFKKKKPKNIPSMTKKEFLDFEKARELIKFLKEFE